MIINLIVFSLFVIRSNFFIFIHRIFQVKGKTPAKPYSQTPYLPDYNGFNLN